MPYFARRIKKCLLIFVTLYVLFGNNFFLDFTIELSINKNNSLVASN